MNPETRDILASVAVLAGAVVLAVVTVMAAAGCYPSVPNYNRCAAGVWCGDDDAGVDAGCADDVELDAGNV